MIELESSWSGATPLPQFLRFSTISRLSAPIHVDCSHGAAMAASSKSTAPAFGERVSISARTEHGKHDLVKYWKSLEPPLGLPFLEALWPITKSLKVRSSDSASLGDAFLHSNARRELQGGGL